MSKGTWLIILMGILKALGTVLTFFLNIIMKFASGGKWK